MNLVQQNNDSGTLESLEWDVKPQYKITGLHIQ